MRDIQEYAIRCMEMLDKIGVPYGNIQNVTVNNRAKKRWGLCSVVSNGFDIQINAVLLDETIDESGLMNTMLHELLHTVPGCMNHGAKWKAMADKVYKAYGIYIKRCSNAAEKGVAADMIEEMNAKRYKYFVSCPDCGHVFKYMRMCDCVKNPGRYHHTGCKSNLVRIFEI